MQYLTYSLVAWVCLGILIILGDRNAGIVESSKNFWFRLAAYLATLPVVFVWFMIEWADAKANHDQVGGFWEEYFELADEIING